MVVKGIVKMIAAHRDRVAGVGCYADAVELHGLLGFVTAKITLMVAVAVFSAFFNISKANVVAAVVDRADHHFVFAISIGR